MARGHPQVGVWTQGGMVPDWSESSDSGSGRQHVLLTSSWQPWGALAHVLVRRYRAMDCGGEHAPCDACLTVS